VTIKVPINGGLTEVASVNGSVRFSIGGGTGFRLRASASTASRSSASGRPLTRRAGSHTADRGSVTHGRMQRLI
jgi:hypothetical protein